MTLRYQTNSAHFDFPEYPDFPRRCYVIASSPRCGSNMLQRALWQTALAGAPEEYLTDGYAQDFALRWDIVNSAGGIDAGRYLQALMRYRTSPNGVFGLKVHGSHLGNTFLKQLDLDYVLRGPAHVLIRRRDKCLQAVSYALARQTGVWILDGAWLPDKEPAIASPVYSFAELMACLEGILQEEATWDRYFTDRKISPLMTFYEDIVNDYENEIGRVLSFLNVDEYQGRIKSPGIKKQGTGQNKEWADRFRDELRRAHGLHSALDPRHGLAVGPPDG